MIGGVSVRNNEILVAAADEFNWCIKVTNISGRQIKNSGFNLEADPFRAG